MVYEFIMDNPEIKKVLFPPYKIWAVHYDIFVGSFWREDVDCLIVGQNTTSKDPDGYYDELVPCSLTDSDGAFTKDPLVIFGDGLVGFEIRKHLPDEHWAENIYDIREEILQQFKSISEWKNQLSRKAISKKINRKIIKELELDEIDRRKNPKE